jgi:membrane-associated PAP2 superfamily phosphatase
MTWGILDTILVFRRNNHSSEKENKCVGIVSTYGLIAIIVTYIKNKKDLHQPWELSVFGSNFKNLIKNEKILGYLFSTYKFIE